MWQLSELNALRQTQIATAYYIVSKRALPVGDEELESAVNYLKPNRIGFVEQESPSTGEVVICFYVLFADHSQPAYLTLIGHSLAKLHGELRAEFNEVILQRLASLWSMDDSPAPEFSSR